MLKVSIKQYYIVLTKSNKSAYYTMHAHEFSLQLQTADIHHSCIEIEIYMYMIYMTHDIHDIYMLPSLRVHDMTYYHVRVISKMYILV